MAPAPLVLLIAAAVPRVGDVAVLLTHAADAAQAEAIVAQPQDAVEAAKPAPRAAAKLKVDVLAPAPLARVKRAPAPPVLVDAAPLRVSAQAPSVAPRFEPAQPQAPPAR